MKRCYRHCLRAAAFLIGVAAVLPDARVAAQPAPTKAHNDLVHCVAVSPDGKLLATAGFDNTVKLWEINPDGTIKSKEKKVLAGHTGPVYAVAFDPKDGKTLATASQDKTARVWDVADGKMKFELKGHTDIVDTVAFSPDGKLLASAGADKAVKLWNPADGKEVKSLGTHDGSVYTVAFSPDGKLLASAGSGKDNLVKIWDVKDQKEVKQLKGHEQPVTSVVFAGNTVVVTTSMDRTIRVWSATDGKETKKLGPTADDPYSVAWSEKTKQIAVCGYSGQVTVWALDADKPKFTHAIKSPGYCIAFTPDGKGVYTGHNNGTVAVTPIAAK
jgi:WD40 repeat protein